MLTGDVWGAKVQHAQSEGALGGHDNTNLTSLSGCVLMVQNTWNEMGSTVPAIYPQQKVSEMLGLTAKCLFTLNAPGFLF